MFFKVTVVTLFCFSVNGQENFGNKSNIGYDAGELLSAIFSGNTTQSRRLIKFEDQFDSNYVSFGEQTSLNTIPGEVETDHATNNPTVNSNVVSGPTNVKFDNFGHDIAENGLKTPLGNNFQSNHGKKKRRRRKPRQQFPGQPGYWYPGPIGTVPGPGQNFGPNRLQSDFNGQLYRPPRRPRPSLTSDALSAIIGALTSVAHNDDYQCVARLLCEAATGGGLGGSSLLESVTGLQPLLTLLSAYNGISSNPLFVFGRAVFLGVSSKGSPGSCRYAYPLCPTDPEQLVHYLNNHNGGFFRFFNVPQNGQQNLEQFYNQLSQNYGLYQQSSGNNQEFYGLLNSGLFQNAAGQPNLYPNDYGYQQNYGFAYPHNQNYNNGNAIRFKNYKKINEDENKVRDNINENEIQKRIQNRPARFLNDNSVTTNSKWLFPDEGKDDMDQSEVGALYINADDLTGTSKGKKLKFPETDSTYNNDLGEYENKNIKFYTSETTRTPKAISFSENQNYVKNYTYYTDEYYRPVYSDSNNYLYNTVNKDVNNYMKRVYNNHNSYKEYHDEPGVTTVYVVRGNGDPNKPEIIKLRPGESL